MNVRMGRKPTVRYRWKTDIAAKLASYAEVVYAAAMKVSDKAVAGVATASGLAGLLAAASCCVLPLALAGIGVGMSGLTTLVPLHAPLSAVALVAVIGGWFLYYRRKRACAAGENCSAPSPTTFALLAIATAFVMLSAAWPLIEAPLMRMVEP